VAVFARVCAAGCPATLGFAVVHGTAHRLCCQRVLCHALVIYLADCCLSHTHLSFLTRNRCVRDDLLKQDFAENVLLLQSYPITDVSIILDETAKVFGFE